MTPQEVRHQLAAKRTDAPTPYRLTLHPTAHDVAMRLVRQRGTATCTPEFIAAYLAHEEATFRARVAAQVTHIIAALAEAQAHPAKEQS